jgi:alkanesulfonate monooxygenase SsuD/methylene tetrahydromethanopterin reductase-like flavin-dependent oxidoreductase (luciferase family)
MFEGNPALAHNQDAVGKRDRFIHIMRHQQDAWPVARDQLADEILHADAREGIEGLVGSYDEVAARIRAFHAAGIELFMLQFQPFEAEMERFAKEVIPRVRQSEPLADKSPRLAGSSGQR